VLVEKPGARFAVEIERLDALARIRDVVVRVGFNHRCHRALRKAYALVQAGDLGELMFLRARYGHGGRIGYDREWRADPKLSGGGELIDQGASSISPAGSLAISSLCKASLTPITGTCLSTTTPL
jgi:predicted dehydrogenase